jgi:diacylglycerol kinase
MTENKQSNDHGIGKFGNAIRGIWVAVRAERSFLFHLLATAAVVAVATVVGLSAERWGLLLLCIVTVLAAEIFNTAIERICRVLTSRPDPEIRNALDMAAGAVLVSAIGAAVVGAVVLVGPLMEYLRLVLGQFL